MSWVLLLVRVNVLYVGVDVYVCVYVYVWHVRDAWLMWAREQSSRSVRGYSCVKHARMDFTHTRALLTEIPHARRSIKLNEMMGHI